MSRFVLSLSGGSDSRPLRQDEELAYLAEKAWRVMGADHDRDPAAYSDFVRADAALWDATGEPGYVAAVAWGRLNYDEVRELPRSTVAEMIHDRIRQVAT